MCRTEFGVLPVGDVINWHNEDFIQPNTASLEKLVVLTVYSNLVYMMRLTALWHRGFALFCGGRNAYVQMRSSLSSVARNLVQEYNVLVNYYYYYHHYRTKSTI